MEKAGRDDIQASLAGDGDAFARLIERHEPQVARLMWRFSRDPAQCEELVQEVFVQAYFSLRTYRAEAPFSHWLSRIATRVGYRFWKKRSRETARVSLADIGDLAADGPVDPSAAGEIVQALLGRLKPDDRLVLTLEYFERCSVKEIANRTGWRESAVKMRAHRARRKLKAIAERERLLEALGWTN